ncbi:hypothetical protein, partial [Burkholderia thailandensis]|uniref:hypothetical protein n=1 Tax=Burkholderia thailandensis TaxID=57975 RepID=UPI001E470D5D
MIGAAPEIGAARLGFGCVAPICRFIDSPVYRFAGRRRRGAASCRTAYPVTWRARARHSGAREPSRNPVIPTTAQTGDAAGSPRAARLLADDDPRPDIGNPARSPPGARSGRDAG